MRADSTVIATSVSVRARLVMASLRAQRSKRFYGDPGEMVADLGRHQRASMTRPPWWLRRRVRYRSEEVAGTPCRWIEPAAGAGRVRVLYLHGGGFVEQPQHHHWRFLRWLVETTGASVVMPIYPLAPAADHRAIRRSVRAVYDLRVAIHPGPRVVAGDSAGGALAVDLACSVRDEDGRIPSAVALGSPWLDMGVSDPRSDEVDPYDPELDIDGLKMAGRWYAGPDGVGSSEINPLAGDLTGLPPTVVLTGTRDLLNPDARRFVSLADAAGVDVELHEYPGMFHNWYMHLLPEGEQARRDLAVFLGRTGCSDGTVSGTGVSRWNDVATCARRAAARICSVADHRPPRGLA
ncbi:alpha/beta hydrolase [Tsukamurella sp. 8F]|uniref:alpha/beta hydrolase n=1 Tax=unclassified Tsukamurella TaxID=2633480 RepID=UPI0023B97A2C|nr:MULTISPECIES: alpha/beta hydrolase [unclassified Tsukamurella]MDF0532108.1 alpha/beta hydrolase [Tsukamurella sp. 8J]MDF0589214.1 alpha/beta hydrolase [Tsukamurella sp. 8F]